MKSATLVALMRTRFALKLAGQSTENIPVDKKLLSLLANMKANATDCETADLKRKAFRHHKLAVIAFCEEGWLVDHQQSISQDVFGSGFHCPTDLFAVDKPYNAATSLNKPAEEVASLLNHPNVPGELKNATKVKRRKKRKSAQVCSQNTDYQEKWRDEIVDASSKLLNLGKSKEYFHSSTESSLQAKAARSYIIRDTVSFSSLVNLAKTCGSYDGYPEYVKVQNGTTIIPNVIGKVIENSSQSPVAISAFETKFLLPSLSRFFMSDVEDLSCLVNGGGEYDVIVIDPPWENKSVKRSKQYEHVSLKQIKSMPIPDLASDGALVIIWVTNKTKIIDYVKDQLLPAWKIKQIGEWHWVKVTRKGEFVFDIDSSHKKPYESLIIGRFTKTIDKKDNSIKEDHSFPFHRVISSIPAVLHSRKPSLQDVLSDYLPPKPRCLELFARCLLPGWTSWGNEVLKFQNIVYFEKDGTLEC